MVKLEPAVEQQLADLSDDDWRALSARVRPPTSTQQLRDVASQVLSGDQLDSFMAYADPKRLAGENGDIDEQRVMGHLTALFGTGQRSGAPQYGQHSGQPPAGRPGDEARAALERRHGVKRDTSAPDSSNGSVGRGEAGRAALRRRHGKD
jgi:hypothetical protein